jgi:hypothetical protein
VFQRFVTSVCIASALPPNEVRERIHAASAGLTGFRTGLESPLRGSVQSDGCELVASGGGRDLQKRVLRLSFLEQPDERTTLRGEFALRPLTIGFVIVWFSFVVLLLMIGMFSHQHGHQDYMSDELIVVPCGMLTFGVLFTIFLFFLGRWHERSML